MNRLKRFQNMQLSCALRGPMFAAAFLVLTGCDNKKVEDLQMQLLKEKEMSIRSLVDKENARKELDELKIKLQGAELSKNQAIEKLKADSLDHQIAVSNLSIAKEKLGELEAKLSVHPDSVRHDFKVSSSWWDEFLKSKNTKYSRDSDGDIIILIGSLKLGLFQQKNSLTLRFNFGNGAVENANRWNSEKRFSQAFITKDGGIYLQADLDLNELTSEEYVKNWYLRFIVSLQSFAEGYLK
jgi:hypothetical protein